MTYPLNSTPGTAQQGVLNQIYGVTKTHGMIQLPLVGQFSMTPKFGAAAYGEMGTNADVLITQNYKNVEVSFEIMKTDIFTIYNLVMDLAPAVSPQTPLGLFPQTMYQAPFCLFGNQLSAGESGSQKDIEGFVITNCVVQSIDSSSSRDNDAKLTVKVLGIWQGTVASGGVLYSRLVSTGAPYYSVTPPQPADIYFSGSSATLTKAIKALPSPGTGNTTTLFLAQLKNGQNVNPLYGLSGTASSATVTAPSAPASTDVWDVFTAWDGTSPAM